MSDISMSNYKREAANPSSSEFLHKAAYPLCLIACLFHHERSLHYLVLTSYVLAYSRILGLILASFIYRQITTHPMTTPYLDKMKRYHSHGELLLKRCVHAEDRAFLTLTQKCLDFRIVVAEADQETPHPSDPESCDGFAQGIEDFLYDCVSDLYTKSFDIRERLQSAMNTSSIQPRTSRPKEGHPLPNPFTFLCETYDLLMQSYQVDVK